MNTIVYIVIGLINLPFLFANPANWINAVAFGWCMGLAYCSWREV